MLFGNNGSSEVQCCDANQVSRQLSFRRSSD